MNSKFLDEIKAIINSDFSDEEVREQLDDYHEADIADVVEELTKEERLKLYRILGLEQTSELFSYLEDVEDYIEEVSPDIAADIIEKMDVDDAMDILDELDEDKKEEIISLIEDEEVLEDLNIVDSYEEDQVGSLLTTNYIYISKNLTIKQAMREMIAQASENDNVSMIFTYDENNKYYGVIELRDLIIARAQDNLEDIIRTSYPVLYDYIETSDIINDVAEYELDIIPVLNKADELIGVVTSSDITEQVSEELIDDYVKLAGVTESEDIDEGTLVSVKKRIPWLIILLFMGLFVSFITSNFEGIVRAIPMIVFFQSVVIGMGGNAGTQSLAVTIRLLNEEDIDNGLIFKTIFKEFKIGFLNGLLLSVISTLLVFVFLYITKTEVFLGTGFVFKDAFETSLVVGLSLLISISVSTLIGSLIPIVFTKLKIDPAVASGPFITTTNDLIGIIIYYTLTYFLLMYI